MIKILRTPANKILRTATGNILRRFIQDYFYPDFGLLYNYYVVKSALLITSSNDWNIPTFSEWYTLRDYLGGVELAGGKLKRTGLTHWESPNTGATNESGFNSVGAGYRGSLGDFILLKITDPQTTLYESGGASIFMGIAGSTSDDFGGSNYRPFKNGMPIRLIYSGAGTPTLYTGNDGKIYRVVAIGTSPVQYWLADNLCETRFRDGSVIPWHGADAASFFTEAEWAALTTPGCAAYNNDVTNVAPGFTFPSS